MECKGLDLIFISMSDKNRKLVCKHCDRVFSRGSALKTHMMFKHENYKLKTTDCKWDCGLSTHNRLEQHEELCWNNPNNLVYCQECGYVIKRGLKTEASNDDRKFCGSSCSAKVANRNREVTWGEKTRLSINEYYDNHEYFRDYDRISEYKEYRKMVNRYSIQQLKSHRPDLYEMWKSNPWTVNGDTSKLSLDHIKQVHTCWCEMLDVETAGDIRNLQIITFDENLKRQVGYNPRQIYEDSPRAGAFV